MEHPLPASRVQGRVKHLAARYTWRGSNNDGDAQRNRETKAAVRSMGSCWTVNGLKALKREALARVVAVATSASVCVNMTTTEQRKIDSVVVVYLRVLNKGTAVQTEEGIRPPRNLEEVKRWRITPCAVEVAVRSFRWLQTALRHLEAHKQAISTVRGSKGKEADAVFSRNDQLLETAHIATRFQQDVEGYRNISGCETCFELWDECRTDWKLFISIPPKKEAEPVVAVETPRVAQAPTKKRGS